MQRLTTALDEALVLPMCIFKGLLIIAGIGFALLCTLVSLIFLPDSRTADRIGIWIKNRVETLVSGESEWERDIERKI